MRLLCFGFLILITVPIIATSATSIKGQSITKVRQTLIKSGWTPRRTYLMWGENNDEPENKWGDAGALYKAGFVEVEMCSGTGKNFCFFNYQHGGKCLRLMTQGEFIPGKYAPLVIQESSECPSTDALEPQKHAKP